MSAKPLCLPLEIDPVSRGQRKAGTCYLSLENVDRGPFRNDAQEVEDKVCELKKNDNP